MPAPNIILTGLARGGTTLACHLLNKLPNVVALHEPMAPLDIPAGQVSERVYDFFQQQRNSLLTSGIAASKSVDDAVPDNHLGEYQANSKRFNRLNGTTIRVEKPLDENLRLVIKHPAFFTAVLPELTRQFPCFAVIRNPLSVLLSWRSTEYPVASGRSPAAEFFDASLAKTLGAIPDILPRQLALLSWFYDQYERHLTDSAIVRYEAIVETGGRTLSVVHPAAAQLAESLSSRNRNSLYDYSELGMVAEALLNSSGGYWRFYSKADVRSLL